MTHDKSREDKELYDRWRDLCVDQIKEKLKLNVEKRKKNFEDVVTSAAHKILRDKTLEIVRAPPAFRISSTIQTEALDRMCKTIESWPGVHLSQCKKLPPIFKKYWRIADNWWNRQKGKWFGDLFFWPILNYNLHQYCKKILMNKENKVQYDYLFYIFLCDILHSKVSFKKARPNPLIFDLALDKSDKLQKWFGFAGEQHGVVWDITTKNTKKSIKDYAQSWVKAVKDRKLNLYIHFTSVNDGSISKLLNVIPIMNNNNNSLRDVKIKRNSDSHKSNGSFSFHSDNSNSDNKYIETDNVSGGDEDNNNNNNNNKSEQEIFRLKDKCQQLTYALQQQQYINQQQINALSEMQMNQIYKDQYIAQQQYLNQQQINDYNESQIMQALEQIEGSMQQPQNGNNETNSFIKQELYNDQKQPYNEYNYFDPSISNNNINQPVFLPQPTRYSGSAMSAPQPILNGNNILPPPLKTSVGQQRRQSYHDVLLMKQYYKKDIKPESLQSTNHSTHTTASHSHTTVVSNMPPPTINNLNRQSTPTTAATAASTIVSTPSGSDVSAAASVHSVVTNPNRHFYYPNNNYPNNNYNAMSALPSLQIYGNQHNNYHYQQHYYHLPPPILPQPILTQQMPMSPNLLPPPPPNNNSAAKPRRPSQISHQSHPSHPSLSAHSHQTNNGIITPPINSNNHSTNNSFELMNSINSQFAVNENNMDNNYNNIEIPFDNIMDMNIDNILNNLSAPNSMPVNVQTSGSNLSLNANFSISDQIDIGFGSSNPNFNMNSVTNMSISHNGGMSMSNVGMDSDQ